MDSVKTPGTCFLFLSIFLFGVFGHAVPSSYAQEGVTLESLENELSSLEQDIAVMEKEINKLLEDINAPKLTSISLFFSSESFKGRIPMIMEVILDGRPLTTKDFTETDRLILVKGGALELYSGTIIPESHKLAIKCHLKVPDNRGGSDETIVSTFSFEPIRSSHNFVEVTLAPSTENKTNPVSLSAKHWYRSPH